VASPCNNAAIGITFTSIAGEYYEASFHQFTTPPRQYIGGADLTFSLTGSAIQSGNSRPNRMTWAIATYGSREDAYTIDEMYRSWDVQRSTGRPSVLAIADQTFVRNPLEPIIATAAFTAAPTFEQRSGDLFLISFGLTEI